MNCDSCRKDMTVNQENPTPNFKCYVYMYTDVGQHFIFRLGTDDRFLAHRLATLLSEEEGQRYEVYEPAYENVLEVVA